MLAALLLFLGCQLGRSQGLGPNLSSPDPTHSSTPPMMMHVPAKGPQTEGQTPGADRAESQGREARGMEAQAPGAMGAGQADARPAVL